MKTLCDTHGCANKGYESDCHYSGECAIPHAHDGKADEKIAADAGVTPPAEPSNAEVMAAVLALHSRFGALMTMVSNIGEKVQATDEFVGVLKNVGAQAASGNGMQSMMLRNMVPGIELLGQ